MAAYDRRAITDLFDVDDGPMLRNRQMVMAVCVVQVSVAILLGLLQAARRRGAILLILNPFFIAAGVLGYLGAKRCQPVLVMAHFTGSAGLSLLFGFFILAESFLKRSGQDLFVFFINFPMDLFLLSTAGFSVTLYLSLVKYHAALKEHRQQMREHFQLLEAGERGGGGGAGGGEEEDERTDGPPTPRQRLRWVRKTLGALDVGSWSNLTRDLNVTHHLSAASHGLSTAQRHVSHHLTTTTQTVKHHLTTRLFPAVSAWLHWARTACLAPSARVGSSSASASAATDDDGSPAGLGLATGRPKQPSRTHTHTHTHTKTYTYTCTCTARHRRGGRPILAVAASPRRRGRGPSSSSSRRSRATASARTRRRRRRRCWRSRRCCACAASAR